MITASPWDALMRAQRPVRLRDDADGSAATGAREGTKLARVLAELAEVDDIATLALCVRCDLEPQQVWGLLKAPRAAGQVSWTAGRWALNREWRGRDIERAAALLREAGWTVLPPDGRLQEACT